MIKCKVFTPEGPLINTFLPFAPIIGQRFDFHGSESYEIGYVFTTSIMLDEKGQFDYLYVGLSLKNNS